MGEADARELLVDAVRGELLVSARASARIRLTGAIGLTLLAAMAADLTGLESWRIYLAPLAGYTALAALVQVLLARQADVRIAQFATLLDVGIVALVQWRTLPHSMHAPGAAAFTIALMALVIVMDGAVLPKRAIVPFAIASGVIAWPILVRGGSDVASRLVAAAVLALVGFSVSLQRHRREELALRFAMSEVARARGRIDAERALQEKVASERRLAEERERRATLERLQLDKDTLTQVLVHDLRSPLSVVSSYLELIRSYAGKPGREEKIKQAVDESLQVSDRLTRLISDILDVQPMEDGRLPVQRARVDVGSVAGSVARAVQRSSDRHEVELETEPGAIVDGDANLLARVLDNLVANARKYTPDGARIRVSVAREGHEVVARVQNDGVPIAEELKGRVFEKYQQAKDARHGYGLGLYFSRLAVEGHGGRIRVADLPGGPVTFEIRLPARAEETPTQPVARA